RWQSNLFRDAAIAFRFAFLSNTSIEVVADEPRQVAGFGVREEKLLGQHTAGRKDTHIQTSNTPACERRSNVRVDLRAQRAVGIAFVPDLSLQRFQSG